MQADDMRPTSRCEAGFTLTELMVVVVIIGILAAVAAPSFSRQRKAREGRDFASQAARDLQRARFQAVGDRQILSACIYADRIEFWAESPPNCPAIGTPLRRLIPNPGVSVTLVAAGGTSVLPSNTAGARIDFSILGQARMNTAGQFDNIRIETKNVNVTTNHPEYDHRVDVTAFTGAVQMRTR